MQKIGFFEREYYMLSNWSAHAIDWKGKRYMCVDHVYHSEKFKDEKIKEEIRNAKSLIEAKEIAGKYKDRIRKDWEEIKIEVMKAANIEKTKQHKEVRDALTKSGNTQIIEDSPYDSFWGTGPDGKGENMMGRIWMEIRDNLNTLDQLA